MTASSDLVLTLATYDHDRVSALFDGRVTVPGCHLDCVAESTSVLFPLSVGEARFDITEVSLSSYLMQISRGEGAYWALPVYLSRAFRHGGIYVRRDAGISEPRDLEGKAVGVPEYQMTAAVWMRGILRDEYGVRIDQIQYHTGALDSGRRDERLPLVLPDSMDVQPISPGENLNAMLLDGRLDAILAPSPPGSFLAQDRRICRLFADYGTLERAYYRKTGFFPIMHLAAVRKSLVEDHPWLPMRLYSAFLEARDLALGRLEAVWRGSSNRLSLPWLHTDYEATRELMGENVWSYGLEANRAELDAFCRYSHEQHLSTRRLTPDELFHPSLLG